MNQTWENNKKHWVHFAQIWPANFFFLKSGFVVTRYHGQLSWSTISEKANDAILRKLSDQRTDRPMEGHVPILGTDGQTDKSDFIGSCMTNLKRPIVLANTTMKKVRITKWCRYSRFWCKLHFVHWQTVLICGRNFQWKHDKPQWRSSSVCLK